MPDTCHIEPARIRHWPALARIIRAAMKFDAAQTSYYLRHCLPTTGVAVLEGRPVGCFVYHEIADPEVAWFDLLAVDPALQGRGIGQQLLSAIERHAANNGFSRIEMSVDPNNTRAWRLYEHIGYTRIDRPGKVYTYAKPISPTRPRRPKNLLAKILSTLQSNLYRFPYALLVK